MTLDALRQVPIGATVDVTRGGVRRVSAGADVTRFVTFTQGAFRITGRRALLLSVTLADRLVRPRGGAARAGRKPRARCLWGDGKGSFRVAGKHSAAIVRGTRCLVQETRAGTLTRVAEAVVAVENFRLGRAVTVTAGRQYVARG